jgi:hypothetical protein
MSDVRRAAVFRVPMAAPDDMSGLSALLDAGALDAASVVGDPMLYVSGGAEHQGPAGGGLVAVIARARPATPAT